MKVKTVFAAVVLITILTAFKLAPESKGTAIVDQQQGVYIFMLSKPTVAYDYLGSVKKGAAWSGQPSEMLSGVLKKVKKDYPKADGLIFTTLDMDKADAIKFKE